MRQQCGVQPHLVPFHAKDAEDIELWRLSFGCARLRVAVCDEGIPNHGKRCLLQNQPLWRSGTECPCSVEEIAGVLQRTSFHPARLQLLDDKRLTTLAHID